MIGPLSSPRLRPPSALHCVAPVHARALDPKRPSPGIKGKDQGVQLPELILSQFYWLVDYILSTRSWHCSTLYRLTIDIRTQRL